MGWEYRKGKPYFYRKERRNGKVVSVYCGAAGSDLARLWSSLAVIDREIAQREAAERQFDRAAFEQAAATPPELAVLLGDARTAVHEALTLAGFHQHKRQWRKKRANQDEGKASHSTGSDASTDHSAGNA
jgi:hypothetical protein